MYDNNVPFHIILKKERKRRGWSQAYIDLVECTYSLEQPPVSWSAAGWHGYSTGYCVSFYGNPVSSPGTTRAFWIMLPSTFCCVK